MFSSALVFRQQVNSSVINHACSKQSPANSSAEQLVKKRSTEEHGREREMMENKLLDRHLSYNGILTERSGQGG